MLEDPRNPLQHVGESNHEAGDDEETGGERSSADRGGGKDYQDMRNSVEGYHDDEGNWVRPEGAKAEKKRGSTTHAIAQYIPGLADRPAEPEKAKELYQRFPEASAQMLLPLILLSLKYDDELSAKRYYKDLQKENKSCKKVFGRREFDLESMVEAIDAVDYLADSEEELYIAISNVMTDFAVVPDMYYFNWLKKNLIKPPSSKPTKPSKKWIQKKK